MLHRDNGALREGIVAIQDENSALKGGVAAAHEENESLLEQLESFMAQAEQLSHAHQRAAEQQANASQIAIQSSVLQLQGLKEENAVLRQQLKLVSERQEQAGVVIRQHGRGSTFADSETELEPQDEGQQGEREEELFEQMQRLQAELQTTRSSHEAYVDVVEEENQQLLEQVHVLQSDQRQGGFEDEMLKKEKTDLETEVSGAASRGENLFVYVTMALPLQLANHLPGECAA
jgi:hypothetical protein